MTIAIDTLMEIVTGIKLEHDPIYLQKRKIHTYRQAMSPIDFRENSDPADTNVKKNGFPKNLKVTDRSSQKK